ncbi:MAG: reverse gyrase [Hydrogenobaculum sp.]|nr:MAG: reverse gyrase [Hydrogenobaculum sp.]
MIEAIFKNLCPNCGGDISSYRLAKGLPCEKCLKEESENVCDALKEGFLKEHCDIEKELSLWEEYFYKYTNLKPWALQKTWAKRVFLKESFSLIAPTGIGKSSFGISLAAFLSTKNKKSYLLLPTKLLLKQTFDRLLSFGVKEEDILIFGLDAKKDKSLLKAKNYKILITTNMFLYKNEELIPRDFDFIFVDDIDSFLKTAKNIDKLLHIMGFEKDIINKTFELLKLKSSFRKNEEKLKALSQEIADYLSTNRPKTVLVLASATSKPKSKRVLAFKELLGFELSTPTYYLRNITDAFDEPPNYKLNYQTLVKYINTFGKGGLVFLSAEKGKDAIKEIIETLNKNHIRAVSYEDIKEEDIKAYENGDIDVLVGIASYRNPLARGIDLPHVIRYAIFYGVPKIEIPLSLETNINHIVMALLSIKNIFINTEHYQTISELIEKLNKYRYVKEENEVLKNLKQKAKEFLSQKDIIEKIENSKDITLKKQNDKYYILIPDVTGYIQASGRTSRLYAGGISKGLSVVLVDDKASFESLKKKLLWLGDIKFENIKDIDIKSILKAIDQDRENLRAFMKKEKILNQKDVIKPTLVIVESPTKAKTISSFFGKPARRILNNVAFMEFSTDKNYMIITASIGHILDLVKNEGFDGVLIKDDHIIPIYETIEGKDNIVKSLRLAGIEIEKVLIATDPDTEGEKIAWDLKEMLSAFCKDIKRMEFHEVTKKAIANAIENPRDIKESLVKAQILRRVSDRWVGFEYSKLIQKHFGKNWLSAGRVQTPVLGWIIERYNLHKAKIFKLFLKAENIKIDFDIEDKTKAKTYYENIKYITIKTTKEEERFLEPPAPYTTDTLLKDASDKLRFSVKEAMEIAQNLFEMGYITYHRTDSTHVSEVGISIAKSFIEEKLGKEYFKPRAWGKEGTHECIRPTKSMTPEDIESFSINQNYGYQNLFTQQITKKHIKLYQLIFNRFMASQTRPVKVLQKTLSVSASSTKSQTCEPWQSYLEKELEVVDKILEDGWNIFIPINTTQVRENNDKPINTFEVEEKELTAVPKAPLYTQGELVKEMKEKGIGRPSTYSIIISRLLERKYVIEKKSRLIPTKLGIEVYNFLKQSKELSYLVSEEFTRELEHKMDIISEEEKEDYKEVLRILYSHLLKISYNQFRV